MASVLSKVPTSESYKRILGLGVCPSQSSTEKHCACTGHLFE